MQIVDNIHEALWKGKLYIMEIIRQIKYHKILYDSVVFNHKYSSDNSRCFIIGNGPSLRIEDLEKISSNRDVSFAANRIYNIFSETSWRPTYYGVCDIRLYKNSKNEIDNVPGIKFLPLDLFSQYAEDKRNDYFVFSRVPVTFFNRPPRFSDSFVVRFGEGGTITYHFLQMAAAMGFKEIFLIGVDFSFTHGIGPDGKYFEDKTIKYNHYSKDNSPLDTVPNLYNQIRAYTKANEYAESHGIHIYNATRGGKLEVFKRVDFDTLF